MFLLITYLIIATTLVETSHRYDGFRRLNERHLNLTSNPEEYLDLPAIAARHGYRAETHAVVTEDGYILSVHRISSIRSNFQGPPVLLQHGILQSSVDWIINGNNSLGYLLADWGYDVWLGNSRGNKYSKAHVRIPIHKSQFWDFSFHEMGIYDLPSVVHHMNNITGKGGDIVYIGHSMGTTMYLIFSSMLPEVAKNIKMAILLAPVAFMTNLQPILTILGNNVDFIEQLLKNLGINEVLPNSKLVKTILDGCVILLGQRGCFSLLFTLVRFSEKDFNWDIAPVVLKQDPAGGSRKTLAHYGQIIKAKGNFQMFDYGEAGNTMRYGNSKPSNYQLNEIQSPIYLMYANADPLADAVDVHLLAKELPNLKDLREVGRDSFSHIDFLFSIYAETYVYQPILKLMSNNNKS